MCYLIYVCWRCGVKYLTFASVEMRSSVEGLSKDMKSKESNPAFGSGVANGSPSSTASPLKISFLGASVRRGRVG